MSRLGSSHGIRPEPGERPLPLLIARKLPFPFRPISAGRARLRRTAPGRVLPVVVRARMAASVSRSSKAAIPLRAHLSRPADHSLWLSGAIASLVSAIPLRWLVAAQVYRIAGGIFLVLWADGRLPWQFALPAGIGDVTTGVLAVVVAARLAQNAAGARSAVYAWCLFGIADLVVAIAMGAMTSPGRPHLFAFEAPNLLITSYPLVMISTLHGLVLSRLRWEPASEWPTGPDVSRLIDGVGEGEGVSPSPTLYNGVLDQLELPRVAARLETQNGLRGKNHRRHPCASHPGCNCQRD